MHQKEYLNRKDYVQMGFVENNVVYRELVYSGSSGRENVVFSKGKKKY